MTDKCEIIKKDATLEELQEFFAEDRFATDVCGVSLVEASYGRSVCEMEIKDSHLNARGDVMGGAIFTLADFALAVACNLGESPTTGISNTIQFFTVAKGKKLIAECIVERSGRSVGFYTVNITDELGTSVGKMSATCFRKG